jgi:HEAT repeat protein
MHLELEAQSRSQNLSAAAINDLIAQLHASNWERRSEAFEKLRGDRRALSRPVVHTALVALLDRENQLTEETLRESHELEGVSVRFGEEFSQYKADLGETVDTFTDWTDPWQVCVSTHTSYDPHSKFAGTLALHGTFVVPCLLEMLNSDLGIIRGKASATLVRTISMSARDLDRVVIERAKAAIRSALEDKNPGVQMAVLEAIGHYGEPEFLPALRLFVELHPAPSPNTDAFHVRADALRAIQEIETRFQVKK